MLFSAFLKELVDTDSLMVKGRLFILDKIRFFKNMQYKIP